MSDRAALVAEAERLRGLGLTRKQIAASMNVSVRSVDHWRADPDGTKAKMRKQSYGGRCEVCGKRTDGSGGRGNAPKRCQRHTEILGQRKEDAQARALRAVELRSAGLLDPEVAEQMGVSAQAVANLLSRARAAGIAVPPPPYHTDGRLVDNLARGRQTQQARARERRQQVAELFTAGLTYAQIAERLGISIGAVNGLIQGARANGIAIPSRRSGVRS